ncbi:unnamed protein product [Rhizophagus irregularis]|nr:unnamed protein product [Rhizophagus irregularis]
MKREGKRKETGKRRVKTKGKRENEREDERKGSSAPWNYGIHFEGRLLLGITEFISKVRLLWAPPGRIQHFEGSAFLWSDGINISKERWMKWWKVSASVLTSVYERLIVSVVISLGFGYIVFLNEF